jgi:hypothetical protein
MNQLDNHILSHQKSMAGIVGAMVHELNNPLQGVMSLLSLHARECGAAEPNHTRIEQLQAGLSRISRVIEDFSVIYENLPRVPENVTVSAFSDRLKAGFSNRQWTAIIRNADHDGCVFSCLAPELIRLIIDAFSIHGEAGEMIHLKFEHVKDSLILFCEQGNSEDPEIDVWHKLDMNGVLSGLPVLLTEIARLGNGEAEFRFDHLRLRGIKLTFITVM